MHSPLYTFKARQTGHSDVLSPPDGLGADRKKEATMFAQITEVINAFLAFVGSILGMLP